MVLTERVFFTVPSALFRNFNALFLNGMETDMPLKFLLLSIDLNSEIFSHFKGK